jgi:hypothetical protein
MANATHGKHRSEFDAGHVPITEEFDSPRRTLPAVAPLAVALIVVVVFIVGIAYIFRSKPVAQGQIDNVFFSQQRDQPTAMVSIQVTLRAVGNKPLYIKSVQAGLKTQDKEYSDEAAAAADFDRYFEAYPDLRDHAMKPIKVEDKIAPGAEERGTIIVTFPVDRSQFDARESLTVTIQPYDQKAIVLKQAGK